MTLPLSDVIQVSVVNAPAGLANFNINNVMLFTTDSNTFGSDKFRNYVNTSQVGIDFGTTSLTYQMAVSFFSQTPNPLSAGGSLIIAPLLGGDSDRETLIDAINRLSPLVFFAGVLDTLTMTDEEVETAATDIQALNLMWFHGVYETSNIAGIATTVSTAGNTHTRLLLHTLSQLQSQLFSAAYASRLFSVDFTGSNTATVMNLKQLATIPIDTGITQTLYEAANIAGIDLYVSYGVSGIYGTSGNDYSDNVYNKLWLYFALEVAGFNYLATTTTKIPQTEPGMIGLINAFGSVFQKGVQNGVIGVGLTWNSPDTFGDPIALKRNILEQGYYMYHIPIAQQSQVQRIARQAPLVQAAVQFSGAIQTASIIAIVEY